MNHLDDADIQKDSLVCTPHNLSTLDHRGTIKLGLHPFVSANAQCSGTLRRECDPQKGTPNLLLRPTDLGLRHSHTVQ